MAKAQTGPILGIDLGTTTSLACVSVRNPKTGKEELQTIQADPILKNDIIPSVVCITEKGVLVGEEAEAELRGETSLYRDSVIRFAKRKMHHESFTYPPIGGRRYSPAQVSGMILKKLKDEAERQLGCSIREAVVTVPAYFGHVERRLTVEAAKKYANFSDAYLLDEPIAAAIGLGLHTQREDQLVMVVDLGGGTLDVTLLLVGQQVGPGGFDELGRDGNAKLGGVDWDEALARIAVYQHDLETRGQEFTRDPDFFDLGNVDLYGPAQGLKEDLCNRKDLAQASLGYWDRQLKLHVTSMVKRKTFLSETQELADLCGLICERLLKQINPADLRTLRRKPKSFLDRFRARRITELSWEDVDCVYMVGGGSLIPAVQEVIAKRWNRDPVIPDYPQHQIAYGAAIAAAAHAHKNGLLDRLQLRSPHTTGYIAAPDYEFEPLIRRNEKIPQQKQIICPLHGRGNRFEIKIAQQRMEIDLHNRKVCPTTEVVEQLVLEDLPPPRIGVDDVAVLDLDYRSDREMSFSAKVRGESVRVKLNGSSSNGKG